MPCNFHSVSISTWFYVLLMSVRTAALIKSLLMQHFILFCFVPRVKISMCKYATNIYFLLKKTPFHLIFIFLFLKESISFVSCFIIRSSFSLYLLVLQGFSCLLNLFWYVNFCTLELWDFFFSFLQQMFSDYSLGKQLILCLFFSSIRVTDSCPFQ